MEPTLEPTDTGAEVRRLLGMMLRRDIGDSENPSRATEPGWDSLKHVEIAFLLEDQFDIRLSHQEISSLSDLEQIVKFVAEKRKGSRCGTASS
jgi:acyl carrier protein